MLAAAPAEQELAHVSPFSRRLSAAELKPAAPAPVPRTSASSSAASTPNTSSDDDGDDDDDDDDDDDGDVGARTKTPTATLPQPPLELFAPGVLSKGACPAVAAPAARSHLR